VLIRSAAMLSFLASSGCLASGSPVEDASGPLVMDAGRGVEGGRRESGASLGHVIHAVPDARSEGGREAGVQLGPGDAGSSNDAASTASDASDGGVDAGSGPPACGMCAVPETCGGGGVPGVCGVPCGTMAGGSTLAAGAQLLSCDGRFELAMQTSDGNLVLYFAGAALWAAKTAGHPGAFAAMQTDGNFVVYAPPSTALWQAVTSGNPGAYLALQNDGNLVVYSPAAHALWSSGTCCH